MEGIPVNRGGLVLKGEDVAGAISTQAEEANAAQPVGRSIPARHEERREARPPAGAVGPRASGQEGKEL